MTGICLRQVYVVLEVEFRAFCMLHCVPDPGAMFWFGYAFPGPLSVTHSRVYDTLNMGSSFWIGSKGLGQRAGDTPQPQG